MNNCVISEMQNNSFIVDFDLTIPDFNMISCNCKCKIDTGCSYSTIPFAKLNLMYDLALQYKKQDILNSVVCRESYGVETGGIQHKRPVSFDEKMECKALKFRHDMIDVAFNDYQVGNLSVFINYDRRGNILIGMDILSKFIIYMDTSRVTGKETLIMTLKSESDKSGFYEEVKKHLNIVAVE